MAQEISEAIKHLADSIANQMSEIIFGLQEWQIKRIEEEQKRWNEKFPLKSGEDERVDVIFANHFWEDLGKEFAWCPLTLALYYFEYLGVNVHEKPSFIDNEQCWMKRKF